MSARALLQAVPDVYVDATRGMIDPGAAPIDLPVARAQHASVVRAMRWLGYDPTVLDVEGAGPDAIFVEDPVLVVGRRLVVARSAHPGRARESERLVPVLESWGLEPLPMSAGTLDGGDVLHVGRTLFVGRSARTDEAGIRWLADALPDHDVVPVELPPGVLHLKCDASPLGDGRVLATRALGERLGVPFVEVPTRESYAANAVAREGRALVAEGFPDTAEALLRAGFDVRAVDTTEIRKGDGSLTCLSVRVEPSGG